MEANLIIDRSIIENFLEGNKSLDFLFSLKKCESCKIVDYELERRNIKVPTLDIMEHRDLARDFDTNTAPTLIRIADGGYKFYTGTETILAKLIKKVDDSELETK